MKGILHSRLLVAGMTVAGVLLLFAFLTSVRTHVNFPPYLFWVSVSITICGLVYQIVKFAEHPSYDKVIIAEIVLANIAFHMIFEIPYPGQFGVAPYVDLRFTEMVRDAGHVSTGTYPYPLFFILFAEVSSVAGASMYDLVKYLPSVLDSAIILFLFLVFKQFGNKRVALFASLLWASLFWHMWLYSTYHYEVLGLLLVVTILYLYSTGRGGHSGAPAAISASIICLVTLVFAHHLSAAYLALFAISYPVLAVLLKPIIPQPALPGQDGPNGPIPPALSFTMLIACVILAHWMYVYVFPFRVMGRFAEGLVTPGEYGSQVYGVEMGITGGNITSVRGYLLLYGTYFFNAVFCLILAYNMVFNRKHLSVWHYHSAFLLFVFGVLGILSAFVLPHEYAVIDSDRVLTWGWLFAFVPLSGAILTSRRRWLHHAGLALVVAFLFFNFYLIGYDKYDPTLIPEVATEEDFALARSMPFSGTIGLYSGASTLMAVYHVQQPPEVGRFSVFRDYYFLGTYTRYKVDDLANVDWLIVRKNLIDYEKEQTRRGETYYKNERARQMSQGVWHLLDIGDDGYQKRNRIYESNSITVFR